MSAVSPKQICSGKGTKNKFREQFWLWLERPMLYSRKHWRPVQGILGLYVGSREDIYITCFIKLKEFNLSYVILKEGRYLYHVKRLGRIRNNSTLLLKGRQVEGKTDHFYRYVFIHWKLAAYSNNIRQTFINAFENMWIMHVVRRSIKYIRENKYMRYKCAQHSHRKHQSNYSKLYPNHKLRCIWSEAVVGCYIHW